MRSKGPLRSPAINLGGAIATTGGVVFIGAALDRRLHAYDTETGRELWQGDLAPWLDATTMILLNQGGAWYSPNRN